jgi:hypothetical protein
LNENFEEEYHGTGNHHLFWLSLFFILSKTFKDRNKQALEHIAV